MKIGMGVLDHPYFKLQLLRMQHIFQITAQLLAHEKNEAPHIDDRFVAFRLHDFELGAVRDESLQLIKIYQGVVHDFGIGTDFCDQPELKIPPQFRDLF